MIFLPDGRIDISQFFDKIVMVDMPYNLPKNIFDWLTKSKELEGLRNKKSKETFYGMVGDWLSYFWGNDASNCKFYEPDTKLYFGKGNDCLNDLTCTNPYNIHMSVKTSRHLLDFHQNHAAKNGLPHRADEIYSWKIPMDDKKLLELAEKKKNNETNEYHELMSLNFLDYNRNTGIINNVGKIIAVGPVHLFQQLFDVPVYDRSTFHAIYYNDLLKYIKNTK